VPGQLRRPPTYASQRIRYRGITRVLESLGSFDLADAARGRSKAGRVVGAAGTFGHQLIRCGRPRLRERLLARRCGGRDSSPWSI